MSTLQPITQLEHQKLTSRLNELKSLKNTIQTEIKNEPAGFLRISQRNSTPQYFHIHKGSSHNGEYLPQNKIGLIQKLAQKSYNHKLLRLIEKEIAQLHSYVKENFQLQYEKLFNSLSPHRKNLLKPAFLPANKMIQEWEKVTYPRKEIPPEEQKYFTAKDEAVRSKSEIIIADTLKSLDIPYRYEFPLKIPHKGTFHPDFLCLNPFTGKEYYWEHFGMMDNAEYAEKAVQKIQIYEEQGLFQGEKLITTFETSFTPLNSKKVKRIAEKYLLA